MRAVEIAEPDVVEPEVILLREPRSAFAIFPNPIAKAILQQLLFLSSGNRLRLIYDTVPIRVLIVGCRCAPTQRLLDQLGRTEAGGTVGRSVVHDELCAVIEFNRPCGDGLSVSDFHARAGEIHDEPRRASISPGSRSFGCTAWSASTFRRYAGSIGSEACATASFVRTL